MIDPDNLPFDSKIEIQLPRIITVNDYHEFSHYEDSFRQLLGIENIMVTEVGFIHGEYVGLIHLMVPHHLAMVKELQDFYCD